MSCLSAYQKPDGRARTRLSAANCDQSRSLRSSAAQLGADAAPSDHFAWFAAGNFSPRRLRPTGSPQFMDPQCLSIAPGPGHCKAT